MSKGFGRGDRDQCDVDFARRTDALLTCRHARDVCRLGGLGFRP